MKLKGSAMKKKPTVSTLKKKLDRIFSEYIRRRDADKHTGFAKCCSCGKEDHWKQMDAGHFVSRKHNATRYDENNVNAQCRKCNRYDEGNKSGYAVFLKREHECDMVQSLDFWGHQTKQFRPPELQALIKIYQAKLKAMPKT